jgi:hypothetical protein
LLDAPPDGPDLTPGSFHVLELLHARLIVEIYLDHRSFAVIALESECCGHPLPNATQHNVLDKNRTKPSRRSIADWNVAPRELAQRHEEQPEYGSPELGEGIRSQIVARSRTLGDPFDIEPHEKLK